MVVRRAAPHRDAGAVAKLLSELGYSTDGANAAARLRSTSEDVLVVEEGGRIIGLATLITLQMLTHERPVGRITALVVSSAQRRRGVARVLVEAVLQRARELGCEGVELTSGLRPEREAAHAFYLAFGFERTSYRYWLPLDSGADTAGSGAA